MVPKQNLHHCTFAITYPDVAFVMRSFIPTFKTIIIVTSLALELNSNNRFETRSTYYRNSIAAVTVNVACLIT